MATSPDNGMVHLSSPHPVAETLNRLDSVLQSRGLAVFARIDHSGEAEKVSMKSTRLRSSFSEVPRGVLP